MKAISARAFLAIMAVLMFLAACNYDGSYDAPPADPDSATEPHSPTMGVRVSSYQLVSNPALEIPDVIGVVVNDGTQAVQTVHVEIKVSSDGEPVELQETGIELETLLVGESTFFRARNVFALGGNTFYDSISARVVSAEVARQTPVRNLVFSGKISWDATSGYVYRGILTNTSGVTVTSGQAVVTCYNGGAGVVGGGSAPIVVPFAPSNSQELSILVSEATGEEFMPERCVTVIDGYAG